MVFYVIASEAKQSMAQQAEAWIASRSLSSGAHSRDPLARNDGARRHAGTTSSLMTKNFTRSIRPKLVVSATSAASRPVPIRMRPMRG